MTMFENVLSVGKKMYQRIQDVHATGLAAQLAFYFLLSLFPFLIFAFTLLPYVGITSEQVLLLVNRYAPDEAMNLIESNILAVLDKKQGGLLSFGIVATIWPASLAINNIIHVLNRAYRVTENRNFFIARVIAIILTLGVIVVIIVALLLPVFGRMIGEFVFSHLELPIGFLQLWEWFRWLISFLVIVVVFTCMYYFAPNKRLRFKEVLIGGFVATVGWQLASYGFSFYVSNFGNYSSTYGSIGGIIVLMLWFYISALIMIIGGILNAVIHEMNKER